MTGPRRRALALWSILLGACAGEPAGPEAQGPPPNVVLFVADTVRADHLSTYGYDVATSPNLTAFAERATRYTDAHSTAPWTLPSHASMFTGLLPFQHHAHTLTTGPGTSFARALHPEATTLAEVLGAAGYRTLAIAANDVFLQEKYGLGQGFERWFVRRVPLASLLPRIFEQVDEDDGRPLFLFVNAMDAHLPYNSAERPGLLPRPVGSRSRAIYDALHQSVLGWREAPDPDELQALVDEYDTGLANLDEAFGDLLEGLEARGVLDHAVILFTADHGEYFGEHDLLEHSKDVYEGALHVPLVVRAPGQREGRVEQRPVGLAHVPSLVCEHLPRSLRSQIAELAPSLVRPPTVGGREVVLAENRFSRMKDMTDPVIGDRFFRERQALYDGGLKWIRSTDRQHELYDLRTDPAELHDLSDDAARVRAMNERLDEVLGGLPPLESRGPTATVDAEERKRLEALGYH